MPVVVTARIVLHQEVTTDHFRMGLQAPEIAAHACAGQFCMVQTGEGYHPFLRRPMSFERIFDDGVSLLYKVRGEGTRMLSRMLPGAELSVQGPLGNGFPVNKSSARHIIVGGGMGVAPFPALAEEIIRQTGKAPEVIIAARTRDLLLCAEEFRQMACPMHLATDDGSIGEKAIATEVLDRLAPNADTCVYACGPMPMMRAVSDVAITHGAQCLVSLEAQMACGDGACLGCVVESKHEKEGERMVRVCADGPVFDATIIDWEAHNLAYDR